MPRPDGRAAPVRASFRAGAGPVGELAAVTTRRPAAGLAAAAAAAAATAMLSPLGVPGAEQPDLVPVYAGPTPADPFGSGHVFDIFDVMEQAELNAAPASRPPAGRRGPLAAGPAGSRRIGPWPRTRRCWWARQPRPIVRIAVRRLKTWALPSRPFMLRRDRHAPRWSQNRGATPAPAVPTEPEQHQVPPKPRPVPIESGPPPTPEPVSSPERVNAPVPELVEAATAPEPAERPFEPRSVEAAAAADGTAAPPPEPPPVPANDVTAGPVVQPIVIGSELSLPLERKRGWWRRR